MAGVVGFEPTIHGTKNRCLTTWLHPNGERLITRLARAVQEPSYKKSAMDACFSTRAGSVADFVRGKRPRDAPCAPSRDNLRLKCGTSRGCSRQGARPHRVRIARPAARCRPDGCESAAGPSRPAPCAPPTAARNAPSRRPRRGPCTRRQWPCSAVTCNGMSRRLKTQSIRWVSDGPRRTLPSLAFNDTNRGSGRFVTGPRAPVCCAWPAPASTTTKTIATAWRINRLNTLKDGLPVLSVRLIAESLRQLRMGFLCPGESCATMPWHRRV